MREIETKNFVPVSEIKTKVSGGLTVLTEDVLVKESLESLANSIPDDIVVTADNLTVYRGKLSELRQMRYALANIQDANNKTLNKMKSDDKAYFDGLISIIQPKEELLKDGVKNVEEEKKRIKQEKAEAELKRKQAIKDDVNNRTNEISTLSLLASTDDDIKKIENLILQLDNDWLDSLQEFEYMGSNLLLQATEYLGKAIDNVRRLKEVERLRAEAAQREKEFAEKEKRELEAAQIENKKRLEELEKMRETTRIAHEKLAAIERKREEEEKAAKEKAEEELYIKNAYKEASKLLNELKKLGSVVAAPDKGLSVLGINKYNFSIREMLDEEIAKRSEKEWRDKLKYIDTTYGKEIDEVENQLHLIRNKMLNDNECSVVVSDFIAEALNDILDLKNYIDGI